jgi:hypothetical protein
MRAKCIEKTGVRDFGFCAQGDNPVWVENGSRLENAVRSTIGSPFLGGLAYTE